MKARVKETGDIVEVVKLKVKTNVRTHSGVAYVEDYISPDKVELFSKNNSSNIDWEQRRWELVKAAMQGYCANSAYVNEHFEEVVDIGKLAISQADAAIAEYKKGGNK